MNTFVTQIQALNKQIADNKERISLHREENVRLTAMADRMFSVLTPAEKAELDPPAPPQPEPEGKTGQDLQDSQDSKSG
jgi:hypothetical protein